MKESEFYLKLLESPCEGCAAYEEIGHCGAWGPNCMVPDLMMDLVDNLLPFLGWDTDDFLLYIFFKEDYEPELFQMQDEWDEAVMAEDEYIHGMWDYEDEPFCYM